MTLNIGTKKPIKTFEIALLPHLVHKNFKNFDSQKVLQNFGIALKVQPPTPLWKKPEFKADFFFGGGGSCLTDYIVFKLQILFLRYF